jgi:hypothetical protein
MPKRKGRAMVRPFAFSPALTLPGLDPGTLFAAGKKDGRVKPGHGETLVSGDDRHCIT